MILQIQNPLTKNKNNPRTAKKSFYYFHYTNKKKKLFALTAIHVYHVRLETCLISNWKG